MRRIALALAAALVASGSLVYALIESAPLDGAVEAVLGDLRAGSGLRIEARGATSVSLLPAPHVRIEKVVVARPGEEPFLTAKAAVANLRVGALLAGRIETREIVLSAPEIALDGLPFADVVETLRWSARSSEGMTSIRIVDGSLVWGGRRAEKVTAGVAWAGPGAPLSSSGSGVFSGKPVEAVFHLANPEAFSRGERTPAKARFEGGGARMTFDGVAEGAWAPQFRGAVALSATSLRDALRWLDAPAPRASSPLSDFRLAGHASLDRGGLSISDAELDLDSGSFVGAGRVTAPGGRLTIEANLDAETLNLKPLARGLAPPVRRNGEWSVAPIDLSPLAGFDLDLRLSAQAVLMGKLTLGPTAATVTVAKGGLDLGVGEALAYGGTIRGRLTLQPDVAGARVAIQGSSNGVRLEETLKHFFDSDPPLSGALSSEAAVQGGGRSIAEIVATLSGRSSARLTDGAIERLQRSRTLALIGIPARMEVAKADAEIVIDRGVARTRRLSIVGPDASFALSGEARLLDRRLDLVGVLRPAAGGWSAPVRVDGPFASPRLRANVSGSVPRQHREAALQR